jgi:nitroreductase
MVGYYAHFSQYAMYKNAHYEGYMRFDRMTHMQTEITQALKWRYATKVFDTSKKVDASLVKVITEAGRMAPTAYGLQPLSIVHVTSDALRAQIRTEAGYNQAQITDASELLIIARRTDIDDAFIDAYIENTAKTRGMDSVALKGFADMMKGDILSRGESEKVRWADRQAYIAFGMMLQSAALLAVDACPMEGFNAAALDTILKLPEKNLASVGLMAIGYRGEGDFYATAPKVRRDPDTFIITY